jgi:hypothetical protein
LKTASVFSFTVFAEVQVRRRFDPKRNWVKTVRSVL